jgi:hypothetical protein
MLDLDSLPPLCEPSATAAEELHLAKEAFEYGVLLSVRMHNKAGFYKNICALKPYLVSNS